MIINNKQNEAQVVGDIQMNRVGIDSSNIDFIATLLTSSLYSKPFTSFLRETVSNAYDSHIEAGNKDPIILLIEQKGMDKLKVSIRDYGVGISPERFETIYRNIGSSTKRQSNDFIGMFGIGRFSVLSCTDVANITSYYNGVKYSYLMYKNNGGINIDKLAEERGNFKNGLEVSAEIPNMSSSEFKEALFSLAMFKNLYVENNVPVFSGICNTFNTRKVARKENLLVCNILSDGTYFKVGNVLYPAKYKSGIATSGIIIELPMGQVDITPNREELQYSQFTIDTIYNASASVLKVFENLIQDKIRVASIQDYYNFCESYYFLVEIDGVSFGIRNTDYGSMKFDITIEGESIPDNFASFFNDISYIYTDPDQVYKILSEGRRYRNSMSLRSVLNGTDDYAIKGDAVTKQVTLNYYRDIMTKDMVVFTQSGLDSYKSSILKRLRTRTRNYDIDKCMNFLFKHIKVRKVLNSDVPQSYIDEFKSRLRSNVAQGNNTYLSIRRYNEDGFVNHEYKDVESLIKFECPTFAVYDSNTTDHKVMKDIAQLFSGYNTVKNSRNYHPAVITMKKSEVGLLKNREKFVHINDFLYLRNSFLEKFVTAYIVLKHFEEIGSFQLLRCKKYLEFRNKYYHQLSSIPTGSNETFKDIVKYFIERGWYNKVDVKYYKISDEDITILREISLMDRSRDDVLNALYYKLYGRNKLLNIAKPKDNKVYEIIKKL